MIDERNRIEVMLNSIATATPITDPRDRLEIFVSAIASALANVGDTNEVEPRDRFELLLDAIADAIGDAGLIVPEALSVTANGTYTAETGKAYTPVTVNVPAPETALFLSSLTGLPQEIATFNDGTDTPLNELEADIEPVQGGTGDPSPENIRAISGWSGASVYVCKKNYFNVNHYYNLNTDYDYTSGSYKCKIIQLVPNKTYTVSIRSSSSSTTLILINNTPTVNSEGFFDLRRTEYSASYTTDEFGRFYIGSISTDENINARLDECQLQIEEGTVATEYEAFSGHSVNMSFGDVGTVYGGTVNITTGLLTVTDANIASYDGETLPSTWISSMDVYAAETTPTTGAQVVYKLETPVTYQLTPVQIRSLLGYNNIYVDCGDVTSCEYFSSEE